MKTNNNTMVCSSSTQLDRFLMNYSNATAENNEFKSEISTIYIIEAKTTVFASLSFGHDCVIIRAAYEI